MFIRTLFLIALISVITISPVVSQTSNGNEKARQSAAKLASSSNDLADIKMISGEKRTGRISSVNADSFDLSDSKSGKSQTIRFSDVRDISKHRKGLSTGAWIAIGAGAAGAIIAAVFLRSRYCNEQAC